MLKYKVYSNNPRTEHALKEDKEEIQDVVSTVSPSKIRFAKKDTFATYDGSLRAEGKLYSNLFK